MNKTEAFPFEKLPHYTLSQMRMINAVVRAFPAPGITPPILPLIIQILQKHLGPQLSARFETSVLTTYQNYRSSLPERFVVIVASLTPHPGKVIIECDFELALTFIDKILGGKGLMPRQIRPMTSLEEGVVEFLAVKVLKELNRIVAVQSQNNEKIGGLFKYDQLIVDASKMDVLIDEKEPMVQLCHRVFFGEFEGALKISFSENLVDDLISRSPGILVSNLEEEKKFLAKRYQQFSSVKTVLWAEIGRVNLTPEDIELLEAGDIILFDETSISYENKKIEGNVELKVGEIENFGIAADINSKEDVYQLKLTQIVSN